MIYYHIRDLNMKEPHTITSTPYVLSHLWWPFDDRAPLSNMIGGFANEAESFPVTRLFEMPRFSTAQTYCVYI
jgi:hypothetical protein